jgi:NAD(P)-dependent dehydrogenase (short-subunit alcohol dehydrogenase family)
VRLQLDSDLSPSKPAGKAARVTGGDSGIGRAIAVAYAVEGVDVVAIAFDQSDDNAVEAARTVEGKGRRCLKLKGDISRKAECGRLVQETVGAVGRLDVLVNNAAVFEGGLISEITDEVLERIFRVNVFAAAHLAQAALRHPEKARDCVINTSSATSISARGARSPTPRPNAR